ncbi:MAG: O-antigen ligase family protein [Parcubacteria group bacterium]|nr:O-antigen ligase family protein [Parcubacteria group bacterium]
MIQRVSKNASGVRISLPYLSVILFWILAAILATPLFVSSQFFFPYIFTKFLYFRTLIIAAGGVWLLFLWSDPRYRPQRAPITVAVILYVLVSTLAALFGENVSKSFWGTVERGEGLFTLYFLALYFVILVSVLRFRREWTRFLSVSFVVSLLASLYAFEQQFGILRAVTGREWALVGTGSRVSSTIGNPAFFAAYLLIHIFLGILLFSERKSMRWRVLIAAGVLFEFVILFFTGTRGALLGLGTGVLIFGILAGIWGERQNVRIAARSTLITCLLLVLVVWMYRTNPIIQKTPGLNRLASISRSDITTRNRLLVWEASWKGWRNRLLLGYGYENYSIPFNKYFPPKIYDDPGSQIWFDRAHNIIFDVGLTGGFAGLAAYGGIFLAAGVSLGKLLFRQSRLTREPIVLVALLGAYGVQNLFVFDTISSYIPFFTVLAYIQFLSQSDAHGIRAPQEVTRHAIIPAALLAGVCAVGVAALYIFAYRFIPSNHALALALAYQNAGRADAALAEYESSLSGSGFQREEMLQKFTDFVVTSGGQIPRTEFARVTARIIGELEDLVETSPYDVRNYLYLMTLHNAARGDAAVRYADVARSLSPTRPHVYTTIGHTYLLRARSAEKRGAASEARDFYSAALENFRTAASLNDRVIESRWQLAAAYLAAGDRARAEEEFTSLDKGFGVPYAAKENLQRLVRIMLSFERYGEAARLTRDLIVIEPGVASSYVQLAILEACNGNFDHARIEAERAVELDANLRPRIQEFLKNPQCLIQ